MFRSDGAIHGESLLSSSFVIEFLSCLGGWANAGYTVITTPAYLLHVCFLFVLVASLVMRAGLFGLLATY